MNKKRPLPKRRKLPHEIPSWVRQGARHYITINCKERDTSLLVHGDHPQRLLDSAVFYENIGKWYLWIMVIMPDHLHFIATFDLSKGIKPTVSHWKRYQKTALNIEWQSDCFEHRLRNDAEFDQKYFYVRENPVRKGLVSSCEQWPHQIDRAGIDAGM